MNARVQRQHLWWWLLMAVVVVTVVVTSASRPPTEGVSDDRMFHIASQLKCVQCVGESVAGSSAPIAVQFRSEIRDQMAAGRTDAEILDYFASHYENVLLTPPGTGIGSLVWVLPVVGFALGAMGLVMAMNRWSTRGAQEVTATPQDQMLVAEALHSVFGTDGDPTAGDALRDEDLVGRRGDGDRGDGGVH